VNCAHPGGVATDKQDQAVEVFRAMRKLCVKVVRPAMKDPAGKSCRLAFWATVNDDIVEEGIKDSYVMPDGKVTGIKKEAEDDKMS